MECNKKIRLYFILLLSILTTNIHAYDFEVDGIYYSKIPGTVNEVEVTTKNDLHNGTEYSGIISIPKNVTFDGKTYNVTSIGDWAFYQSSITNVSIPNSITRIGNYAFGYCNQLTKITLPKSIVEIGDFAFTTLRNLSSFKAKMKNNFNCGNNIFSNHSYESTLFVPNGCKTLYSSFQRYFQNIVESPEEYDLEITTKGNGYVYFDHMDLKNITYIFEVEKGKSAVISLDPDKSCKIDKLVLNDEDMTSFVKDNQFTIEEMKSDIKMNIDFSPISHSLSIKSEGNGEVTYNGVSIRNETTTFTIDEGSSATITFTPDDGYRIKSLKVNNVDKKSEISNNQYTISSISANTTVDVEFEAIPPTMYTLTISTLGYGLVNLASSVESSIYASLRDTTVVYSVKEKTNIMLEFIPNYGYELKSLKINGVDVKSDVSNNKYTLENLSVDTSIDVEFGIINYSLLITSTGSGTVTYDETPIKNGSETFKIAHGSSATLSITPDEGHKIKKMVVDGINCASLIQNNQYTISNITADKKVEVEFEATTYSLTISAAGYGSIIYGNDSIRNQAVNYTLNGGTSVTINFNPDKYCRVKSLKINNIDYTSSIVNNQYTINSIIENTTIAVEYEVIPHTISIKVSGNGYVIYGSIIRDTVITRTMNEGNELSILVYPDNGYQVKSLMVNNKESKSDISSNLYTINKILEDTSIEVEFERKTSTTTTYTLSVKAIGNGKATYGSTEVRNNTSTFTVDEGSSATITFTPDEGYRIKCVKAGSTDVTSSLSNNQYTISSINSNASVEVEFETIPSTTTTYTLSIKATGNGKATYGSTDVRNNISTFTVDEGSSATITFTPDEGYRIKCVKAGSTDVTSSLSNNQYTISSINSNASVEVEFETIPPTTTTYTLSIKATGNGKVTYGSTDVRNNTSTFTVDEGANATMTFSADEGNWIKIIKVYDTDVTSTVLNNQYTIRNINSNTMVEVEFEEEIKAVSNAGVNYNVVSKEEKTVNVAGGDYKLLLDVPSSFTSNEIEWKVVGIEDNVLKNNTELAAIIWNPECNFTEKIGNPNLLLYVKSADYAPSDINNVIVNNKAKSITLTDAEAGNNFYCPQEFTAEQITYEHNYSMKTGYNTCQGWETIVLPFDVAVVTNNTGTELVPYNKWTRGSSQKPFWLYHLDDSDWLPADTIKANTPYIISMPNNDNYNATYNISGDVVFSALNAVVKASDDLVYSHHNHLNLIPNYQNQEKASEIYALNVNNLWDKNTESDMVEGSAFVRGLRQVRPFEAYMTIDSGGAATRSISIFGDGNTTGIESLPMINKVNNDNVRVYSLSGVLIKQGSAESVLEGLPKGVYIIKNRKIVVD